MQREVSLSEQVARVRSATMFHWSGMSPWQGNAPPISGGRTGFHAYSMHWGSPQAEYAVQCWESFSTTNFPRRRTHPLPNANQLMREESILNENPAGSNWETCLNFSQPLIECKPEKWTGLPSCRYTSDGAPHPLTSMETVARGQSPGVVVLDHPAVMEDVTGLDSPGGTGAESQPDKNQGLKPTENKHVGDPDQVVVDSPVVEEATEVVTTSAIVEVQALSEQMPDSNNSKHHNNHRRKQQNSQVKYQPQHHPGTENRQQGLHPGTENRQQGLHWAAVETQVLSPASMLHQLYIAVPHSSDPMGAEDDDDDDIVVVKPAGSLTKRERDKLKKRELRANPIYREKEKERARERMRLKRADPNFRAVEREKDRKRRRLARQRNELLRRFEHNKIRTINGMDPTLPVATCQDNSSGQY
ncbi:uncharacterized protein LOC118404491 [Branchiostoma floridae]|uniref:Uncharacterized protein LOC118404491 n=1 Tax=Branchiostoma floridae TaxID=7739 RepID=A0A9J7HH02_BRAFL|nr:uncharacterized protein LOC118404491 [Branchiostoma floridae]